MHMGDFDWTNLNNELKPFPSNYFKYMQNSNDSIANYFIIFDSILVFYG